MTAAYIPELQQMLRVSRLPGLIRCFSSSSYSHTMLSTSQKRPLLFAHENETISVAGPRTFSVSTTLLKKKEKSRGSSIADSQQTTAKAGVATEDPYDLSSLQAGISTVVSRLRDDLSKLRIGGRFNTESLENLRVCLSKGSKDTLRLGDLAQVVPKGGRTVTILASEEEVTFHQDAWVSSSLEIANNFSFASPSYSTSNQSLQRLFLQTYHLHHSLMPIMRFN